ncbi:hypothetical protein A2U01_0075948, partial [Trifolium medium]|nr:hypothetical protein [Trifolium medium]
MAPETKLRREKQGVVLENSSEARKMAPGAKSLFCDPFLITYKRELEALEKGFELLEDKHPNSSQLESRAEDICLGCKI